MSADEFNPSFAEIDEQLDDPANFARRLELCEQAIATADMLNHADAGFSYRIRLMTIAEFSGHPDRTLNAVAWCLAKCDEDPDRFSIMHVLWQYKWVAGTLYEFHGMSRQVIDDTIEDLERRYTEAGWGRSAAAKLRVVTARNMGDFNKIEQLYEEWKQAPKARGSDCAACNRGFEVETLYSIGKVDEALVVAKPLLSGQSRCATEPQETISNTLQPLLKLGQFATAMRYHQRGVRMMPDNAHLMRVFSRHIDFLTSTHNLEAARNLLQRRIAFAIPLASPFDQMCVFAAARRLMTRLRETGHEGSGLVLPSPLRETVPDDAASLERYFQTRAGEAAAKFDARNGNAYCSQMVNCPAYLTEKPVPVEKTPKRARSRSH